ncbi:MAG: trypsin-like serine protease [Chthoniobacter sp.]|uniref:trypsin-like serine protease n=1 Tax=Chthoniobacter sp. TaxID=2510640 RepID=UPI0032A4506C
MCSPLAKSFFIAALGALAFPSISPAITIRDDTADSSYITLGADPAYQAGGFFNSGFGGTLIADPLGLNQYVITATHLITDGQIVPGSTEFTIGGNSYAVAGYISAPGYDSSTQNNDLTIVRLASSVTGITAVPYYTGSAELGKTITFIGYGLIGNGVTGAINAPDGQRRGANNVVDVLNASLVSGGSLAATSFLTDFDDPSGTSNTLGGVSSSSSTALPFEGSFALGDSGGGAFANIGGTVYLVGVNSYVTSSQGDGIAKYGEIDGFTRVSAFSGFIAQNVPEPGSAALLVGGMAMLGGLRRRR